MNSILWRIKQHLVHSRGFVTMSGWMVPSSDSDVPSASAGRCGSAGGLIG